MENFSSFEEKKENLFLTNYMEKELTSSANWALFISIAMMISSGLYFMSTLSSINVLYINSVAAGLEVILILIFIGLLFGMGIFLFQFSSNLRKSLNQKNSLLLIDSFTSLSRYLLLSFIILIVAITFSVTSMTLIF